MLSVLNLSVRMRRRAAPRPSARLLLIRRVPLSSDMLSSDGAPQPRRDVWAHQNQTHLSANAMICQTQQDVRRHPPVVASSLHSSVLLASTTITNGNRSRHHNTRRWELMSAGLVMMGLNNSEEPTANQSSGHPQLQEASRCNQAENMIITLTRQLFHQLR